MNKKITTVIAAACVVAVLATGCKSAEEIEQSSNNKPTVVSPDVNVTLPETDEPKLLRVSGSGKATMVPDIATVYISVENTGENAADVQDENATISAAVIEAIKNEGVKENNIKTEDIYLDEMYDYSKNTPKLIGYRMITTLHVTIDSVDSVGKVIGSAADAGANNIYGLSFTVSNSSEGYAAALQSAVRDAEIKASAMAEALGVGIYKVPNSINETSFSYTPYDEARDMPAEYEAPAPEANAEGADMIVSPINHGELTVTASVNIDYEMYELTEIVQAETDD